MIMIQREGWNDSGGRKHSKMMVRETMVWHIQRIIVEQSYGYNYDITLKNNMLYAEVIAIKTHDDGCNQQTFQQ